MQYVVPCEVVARLFHALDYIKEGKDLFMCLRLEGNLVIISNDNIMVIQRLKHHNPEPAIHIAYNPELRDVCAKEGQFNSDLTVTINSELNYFAAVTTYGATFMNALMWQDDNSPLHNWRAAIADPPHEQSSHHMVWNAENITNLCKCSPSGVLSFARNIDGQIPTPIRDANDESWLGVMMPGVVEHVEPATVPEWLI